LSRQGGTPNETRYFEQQGQDKKGQRHHKNRYLGIRLGGEIGSLGGHDTKKECRCRGQNCSNDTKKSHEPETFAPGGRRYVHGIDVASSLPMLTEKHRKAVRLWTDGGQVGTI